MTSVPLRPIPSPPHPSRLEKRIVASVLNRIRKNRSVAPPLPENWRPSEKKLPTAKLRQAKAEDCDAIIELKRRWGLIPDPKAKLHKLWVTNPALKEADPRRALGWVLDAAGSVVGYIGNISSTYYYGAEKVSAVTAHALVVEPALSGRERKSQCRVLPSAIRRSLSRYYSDRGCRQNFSGIQMRQASSTELRYRLVLDSSAVPVRKSCRAKIGPRTCRVILGRRLRFDCDHN